MISHKDKEMEMLRQNLRRLEQEGNRKNKMLEDYMKNPPKNEFYTQPAPPNPKREAPRGYNHSTIPNALDGLNKRYQDPNNFMKELVQNKARNPDLNDFERMFTYMSAQEADHLRMMMGIPIGTDLYRFKTEQFKEISTTRAEVEKLTYEQALRSMKKGYEMQNRENDKIYDYLNWVDENRKLILKSRISKDLAVFPRLEFAGPPEPERKPEPEKLKGIPRKKKRRGYDPTEGFVVYWDYNLGLPKEIADKTQFDFQIVRHGEILYDTEEMGASMNMAESARTMRCIFGEKSIIKGIPVDPETLMIWKVKMPSEEDPDTFTEIGWTQIDLFDLTHQNTWALKRGRWKCPLYEDPYSTKITKKGVKDLTPIFGNWFYLRIAYLWDDDEYHQGSLVPEQSSSDAEIPYIHLRAAGFRPKKRSPPPDEIVVDPEPANPLDPPQEPKPLNQEPRDLPEKKRPL